MRPAFHTVCITGGTGSFGQALTRFLLAHTTATIRIYSRDELKQAQMRVTFGDDRVRYFLGDVRDLARLHTALVGVQCVWHAAALKRIDAGEYSPEEFVKTNIDGTMNVISACRTMGVARAIFVSTDKCVSPVNLYGSTKMVAERLWVCANAYTPKGTHYSAIRYGNVGSSRGSVVPLWQQCLTQGKSLPLTHRAMTRFHLSLTDAVQLAWFAANHAPRGALLVPHLPAYSILDLASAVAQESGLPGAVPLDEIGKRPGEKLHESLMTEDEAGRTVQYATAGNTPIYYCIPPLAPSWSMEPLKHWGAEGTCRWTPAPLTVPYSSDNWPWRLSVKDLRAQLKET